jgi:septum formation inhibitor-activating ATPase MinD
MRLILMTGKGGVGKTSVAAATGLCCAELGYRTHQSRYFTLKNGDTSSVPTNYGNDQKKSK